VLAHGGKIHPENCADGGLAFIFSLPKYKSGPLR